MRAVQITRFGGPEVLDVVDLPDPEPGPGEQLFEVSAAGINYADTHHQLAGNGSQGREWSTPAPRMSLTSASGDLAVSGWAKR